MSEPTTAKERALWNNVMGEDGVAGVLADIAKLEAL